MAPIVVYEALDVENYEIRMLKLHRDPPESIVRCTLQRTSLIKPGKYAALSYCWGDPAVRSDIMVNECRISVTVNLADALRQLRLLGVERIWADALCINQDDRQEKSHQIRNMKHIYSRANDVFSWLGKGGQDQTAAAIDFLRVVSSSIIDGALSRLPLPLRRTSLGGHDAPLLSGHGLIDYPVIEPLYEDCNSVDHLSCENGSCQLKAFSRSLVDLFSRPYWTRVWIIQEAAVPPRVSVLCGSSRISLDDLKKAAIESRKLGVWTKGVSSASVNFERIMEFRNLYHTGQIPLCKAIVDSRNFLYTDPRDRIFALLGLCYDGQELLPTPNYQQTLELVFKDLTLALIRKNRCMDTILMCSQAGIFSENLPTWVPDWLNPRFSEEDYEHASRHRTSGYVQTEIISTDEDNVLCAYGMVIGTITITTSPTDGGQALNSATSSSNRHGSCYLGRAQQQTYYRSASEVLTALCSCLRMKDETPLAREQLKLQTNTSSKSTLDTLTLRRFREACQESFISNSYWHALHCLAYHHDNHWEKYLDIFQLVSDGFAYLARRYNIPTYAQLGSDIDVYPEERHPEIESQSERRDTIETWVSNWFTQNEKFTIHGSTLKWWLGTVRFARPVWFLPPWYGVIQISNILFYKLGHWIWNRKMRYSWEYESSVASWFTILAFLLAFQLVLFFLKTQRLFALLLLFDVLSMWGLLIMTVVESEYSSWVLFLTVVNGLLQFAILVRSTLWLARLRREYLSSMINIFDKRRRLFSTSGGLIGVACAGAEAGDKVCFLADCTTAVVLREVKAGGRSQYQVVGKAFVFLSTSDRQIYRGFLERFDSDERRRWIQTGKDNGGLRQFDLV